MQVKWKGLINKFTVKGEGTYLVVKYAEGRAPWGSLVSAEVCDTGLGADLIISLPEQDDRILAVLNGEEWEIWITPRGELHVVKPNPITKHPPEEYIILS